MDCPVKPVNDSEKGGAMTEKSRAMTSPPVILGLDPRIHVP